MNTLEVIEKDGKNRIFEYDRITTMTIGRWKKIRS